MTIKDFLNKLENVVDKGGGYLAKCPVCGRLSLLAAEDDDRILMRCDAGCPREEILAALGLRENDLLFDATENGGNSTPQTAKKHSKEAKKPTLFGLNDLRACFDEKITWLYRDMIPRGMPIIVNGREGDGKTTCCVKIAAEILNEHKKGIIVWIASEGFVQDTKDKLERVGIDECRFFLLRNADGTFQFNFATKKDLGQLDAVLSEVKSNGIPILAVFIDSIRGITPYDDLDSRIKNPMMALNGIICDRHRASLIYIHHLKKGGKNGSLLDRNTGPTSIASSVRAVYSVLPVSEHVRKITLAKTNILGHRPGDFLSVENKGSLFIHKSVEKTEKTMIALAEEWLIDLFSKQSDYLVNEIYQKGEEAGFTPDTLKKAKRHLPIEAHRPVIPGSWHWKCESFLSDSTPYREDGAPLEKSPNLVTKKSNKINKRDKRDKNFKNTPKKAQESQGGQGGQGGIKNNNNLPCNTYNDNNKLTYPDNDFLLSIRKSGENQLQEPTWVQLDFQSVDSLIQSDLIDISDEERLLGGTG